MREAAAKIESILGWLRVWKSSWRRDGVTGTRDACATRKIPFVIFIRVIRVHSWLNPEVLEGKSEHLDPGGDFDVLVTDNEIQRGVSWLARSRWYNWRRSYFGGLFARRTFVLFIVHI
jgi:hypothetical protein